MRPIRIKDAGERARLIGIKGEQMWKAHGHLWPCGQAATAAFYKAGGGDPVSCEVYGCDRWGRALVEQMLDVATLREMLGKISDARGQKRHRDPSDRREELLAATGLRVRRLGSQDVPLQLTPSGRRGTASAVA